MTGFSEKEEFRLSIRDQERCAAKSPETGYQCEGNVGHTDEHRCSGILVWGDDEPPPPCTNKLNGVFCRREEGHEGSHRGEWV